MQSASALSRLTLRLTPRVTTTTTTATTTAPSLLRALSTSTPRMAEGDTGAPKPRGFLAEKDAFQRREAATEAMYIRQLELEKVKDLRRKMKESQKHMEELDKHLEEFTMSQGGEQN